MRAGSPARTPIHCLHARKGKRMSETLELAELVTSDIEVVDLSMIKRKLQDAEEGLGWSVEECDEGWSWSTSAI